jgi:hypothetical protein
MAQETDHSSEDDIPSKAVKKVKKRSLLNALILAGVLVLGAVLPPAYKAFAPLLFVIPFIIAVMNKVRQAGEKQENPARGQSYSPRVPDGIPSLEQYTYKPKDPKDPRRYKPIG